MSKIKINSKDLKKLQKALNEMKKKEFLEKVSKEVLKIHLRNIKKNTPVDTGFLRRSWKTEIKEFENGYELKVYTNVEYAPYVNNGHRIMKNGEQVKYYVGQFFVKKSNIQTEKSIKKIISKNMKKMLKESLK